MKRCSCCKKNLPNKAFSIRRASKDGRGSECKSCRRKYGRLWREKNKTYGKQRAKKLKSLGICQVCAREKPKPGTLICIACAQNNKESQYRIRAKKLKDGWCIKCGKRPHKRGKKHCHTCLKETSGWANSLYYKNYNLYLIRRQEQSRRIRLEIFSNYGGPICRCCGETEFVFLTLDHINNDGAQHRRKVGTGSTFYKWVIANKFPKGLQVLCWNCNEAKRILGSCPHRKGNHARQRA